MHVLREGSSAMQLFNVQNAGCFKILQSFCLMSDHRKQCVSQD